MAETPFSSDDSLYLLYPYGNGFGMADPQLTGYVPPQAPMHMEQGMNMNHDQMDMNHDQMHMNHDNAQMK